MPEKSIKKFLHRFGPLLVLLVGLGMFFLFELEQYLTFEMLKHHRQALLGFVGRYVILAPLIYMLLYILVVAFSVPGGAVMTITGGFLFGSLFGTIYVVIAATIGATILFLIAKTALGESLRTYAGPWINKMRKGFQEDGFHYLLVLRLIPLFPFFVVNLVPAFLGVTTRTYVGATLIGIIPGSFVYATVGAGIGSVFDAGETFEVANIFTTQVWLALIGLAVLAILPVVYRRFKRKKKGGK
ncbi:MAG: TVP38/TMEM64 family protein [Pseudomonadota bacterium]